MCEPAINLGRVRWGAHYSQAALADAIAALCVEIAAGLLRSGDFAHGFRPALQQVAQV
jgi:hypothetical protein